jgi:TRAP-type mannitol/chloroaromatic compound transport system substrate-binding protein
MGFIKRLLGIGVTVGATVAAVKVAEQYKENNPNGVQDVNGDGKVDVRDVASEVVKAATEVYHDAEAAIRQKAPVVTGKVGTSSTAPPKPSKTPSTIQQTRKTAD